MDESVGKKHIDLKDMEVYQLARGLSSKAWEIYSRLHWQDKKIMGDQFVTATDSVGANFTEGYGRYHYMDKVKFCYNARGSLFEAADYWLELLRERKKINEKQYNGYYSVYKRLQVKLNNYISAIYKSNNKKK